MGRHYNNCSGARIVRLSRGLVWLVFLLAGGCTSVGEQMKPESEPLVHPLIVIQTGWHTSLLVDAQLLTRYSPVLAHDFTDQRYFRIGWGDGDYFTGKSKSTWTATKALIASGYSALQVLAYDYSPWAEISEDSRVSFLISEEGIRHLAAYIEANIARNVEGVPILLAPTKQGDNHFYLGTARYSLFNNCNTWLAVGLQQAGIPLSKKPLSADKLMIELRAIAINSDFVSDANIVKEH